MYRPPDIIKSIEKNIRETGNPLGLPNSQINTWWREWNGLVSNRDSRDTKGTVLFTGLMYQLTPYIDKLVDHLYKFENTFLEGITRFVPSHLLRFLRPHNKEDFNEILRKIASLTKSAIDFQYRPDFDFYSGILLYDMGDDEGFANHASFVVKKLRDEGIRRLITIDPHTTYAMRELYPEYADAEFEVMNYLELLDFCKKKILDKKANLKDRSSLKSKESSRITIHDPCYYGRYLKISDKPRRILESLGIEYIDIRNSGRLTSCCGGPVESISPKLTREVAELRYEELSKTGCRITTMCPICLGNLRRFGEVRDISEIIWGAVNA